MIKFSVSRLDKEPIELQGTEPAGFLGLAPDDVYSAASEVAYDLRVSRVSGGALVSGVCRAVIAGECGRCLDPVEREISAEKIEFFVDLAQAAEEVDISEDIRSELLLELPMILLCREDCRGLCPVCGKNLNSGSCGCTVFSGGALAWGELDRLDPDGKKDKQGGKDPCSK